MTAKEVFLRDKALSERWSGFINGPDAPRVLAVADSIMFNEADLTPEMIKGAKRYRAVLESLSEVEPDDLSLPKSGLVHDFDPQQHRKPKGKR